jgi:uncharacterized caspase-like protein
MIPTGWDISRLRLMWQARPGCRAKPLRSMVPPQVVSVPCSGCFLAANASVENLLINGLDMMKFERQLQRTHRNLRQLVLVLDTYHAGTVVSDRRKVRFSEDLAAHLAPAEGLYILGAARAGERSQELPALGHGAFTSALIDGFGGEAANSAGMITVFGLALTLPASSRRRPVRSSTRTRRSSAKI